MKKITSFIGMVFMGVLAFSPVFAAEIVSPDRNDPNVTIGVSENRRNLYTAGSNVMVNGPTAGDLVVAGSSVTLDGSVEDDVMAAGGTLNINGPIGGDARVGGGNINISGTIAGDLIIAGGNVNITERSSIGGDLILAGGNVVIGAPVMGSIRMTGGNLTVNSRVQGEIRATAGERLVFGPRAETASKVYYRAPQEAVFQEGSNVPEKEFSKIERRDLGRGVAAILSLAFLVKLLAWMVAGWLLMRFRGRMFYGLAEDFRRNFWANLGLGAAAFILIPLAIVALLFTFVGYYAALTALLAYLLMGALVCLASALMLGDLVLGYLNKPGEKAVDWQVIVVGVVLWHVIGFIPVAGFIVKAFIFLVVFGAAAKMLKDAIMAERSAIQQ